MRQASRANRTGRCLKERLLGAFTHLVRPVGKTRCHVGFLLITFGKVTSAAFAFAFAFAFTTATIWGNVARLAALETLHVPLSGGLAFGAPTWRVRTEGAALSTGLPLALALRPATDKWCAIGLLELANRLASFARLATFSFSGTFATFPVTFESTKVTFVFHVTHDFLGRNRFSIRVIDL